MSDAAERLARAWPLPTGAPEELDRALGFLGTDLQGRTAVAAGNTAAVAVTVAGAGIAVAAGVGPLLVVATGAALGGMTADAARRGPRFVASVRRTRAAGTAADLVGRVTLRMRIEPAVERAVEFAARSGRGILAGSLDDHVRRARGRAETGLESFADEWRLWFPEVERAVSLVRASAAEPPGAREQTLDRALDVVLQGTREEMAAFAAETRGPLTALYAFGVLVPLALVGVLPAARVSGVEIGVAVIVVCYDLLLPLGLLRVSAGLLAERPVAFPAPRVTTGHPDVPDRRWVAAGAGVTAGLAGGLTAARLVAPWAAPVAGAGLGTGTWLLVQYRPVKRVRDRIREAERELDDALRLVGRRIEDGEAVETAVETVADTLDGPTGDVLDDALGVQRRLGTTVRESFLGPHGVLSDLPSRRLRGAASLLALAVGEGPPAGDAIAAMGDQLTELERIEAESRRELSSVTETLGNTAAVFAPLVGGVTVAMAGSLDVSPVGSLGGGHLPIDALGPAIGGYVLLLAAILTALATGIERGLDWTLVGYRVGVALLLATVVYLLSVVGAGVVL